MFRLEGTPSWDTDIVGFELWGTRFMAISAGPLFGLNPSISFMVNFDPLLFGSGQPAAQEARRGNGSRPWNGRVRLVDFSGASGIAILKFHSDVFAAAPVTAMAPNHPIRFGYGPAYQRVSGAGAIAMSPQWHAQPADARADCFNTRLDHRTIIPGLLSPAPGIRPAA